MIHNHQTIQRKWLPIKFNKKKVYLKAEQISSIQWIHCVIMFMTLYYKERIITISVDLYNRSLFSHRFALLDIYLNSMKLVYIQVLIIMIIGVCTLYTSIFFSILFVLSWILSYTFLLKGKERLIILTFSPYIRVVNEYLTKKMSNFETIYEVELTSYYSMMIGRRRGRTKFQ